MTLPLTYATQSSKPITITAQDDELNTSTSVLLQREYTGSHLVIPSSLADRPCESFGVSGLLDTLNNITGTSYNIDQPGLSTILQSFITNHEDFGTAYGNLRLSWVQRFRHGYYPSFPKSGELEYEPIPGQASTFQHTDPDHFLKVLDRWVEAEAEDKLLRNGDTLPSLPRRVWDLYANRVIHYWRTHLDSESEVGCRFYSISHAWVSEAERFPSKMTPVNGYSWPVPLPLDTSLERIRIELLNLDVEHAWLDILCLRQDFPDSPESQALKALEWRIDVPAIGYSYSEYGVNTEAIHYYSGLGRPFVLDNVHGERHWLNRAWTVQEADENAIIAGLTFPHTGREPFRCCDLIKQLESEADEYKGLFASMLQLSPHHHILSLLVLMRRRYATTELDKVAGIIFPLFIQRPRSAPVITYTQTLTPDNAWSDILKHASSWHLWDLAFLVPYPGKTLTCLPTWSQLMAGYIPEDISGVKLYRNIMVEFDGAVLRLLDAQRISACLLRVVRHTDTQQDVEITVKKSSSSYAFTGVAPHLHPIEDGEYAIIAAREKYKNHTIRHWLLSRPARGVGDLAIKYSQPLDSFFEKVSILTFSEETVKAMDLAGLIDHDLTLLYT